MASTTDIKNGAVLKIDGNLWSVVEFQHVKPGKGGAFAAPSCATLPPARSSTVPSTLALDETATVDRSDYQYLYQDGDDYVFMDMKTYDQINVPATVVGDAANYMLESQTATIAMHEGSPLYIELPASVVLEITYTEPGLQGDRSTGGTKPATVETGYEIQVPLFLETGTKVKVDTRTGEYLGRVND